MGQRDRPAATRSQGEGTSPQGRPVLGGSPIKFLFALEYVLQGLANPFQGITYQPFFRHFRVDYGLSEADTQKLFSRSYLAWSFKPIIGFFMDAFGKTRATLTLLLLAGAICYLLTPLIDRSALVFFWMMFALSVLFAATDVAVDRATVLTGEEESKSTGRSKAATVGLNQSICWAAIYGTGIIAAATGGYIADHVAIRYLLFGLAAVPIVVLLVVRRLPRDTALSIPIKDSVRNFWVGLNTGPVLWIIVFYFFFHFQPALGALWTNYLITVVGFSQTQIGYADAAANAGLFAGVLLFAWAGIRWQDRFGLRAVFRVFILLGMGVVLTQLLIVEPTFSRITERIHSAVPGSDPGSVRLITYATYGFFNAVLTALIRMSTFSLVGAVIPSNAAGSLFAGFMSVANLAYSFSYASGSWLYDNGLKLPIFRALERALFGRTTAPGDTMSIGLLVVLGAVAYTLSFAAVHMLPDRRETQATGVPPEPGVEPSRPRAMPRAAGSAVNVAALVFAVVLFVIQAIVLHGDAIASAIIAFFVATLVRKVYLDRRAESGRTE